MRKNVVLDAKSPLLFVAHERQAPDSYNVEVLIDLEFSTVEAAAAAGDAKVWPRCARSACA